MQRSVQCSAATTTAKSYLWQENIDVLSRRLFNDQRKKAVDQQQRQGSRDAHLQTWRTMLAVVRYTRCSWGTTSLTLQMVRMHRLVSCRCDAPE